MRIEARQRTIDLTCFVTYWECKKCGRYVQTGIRGLDRKQEIPSDVVIQEPRFT